MSAKAPEPAPNRRPDGSLDPDYVKPRPSPPPPLKRFPGTKPTAADLIWALTEASPEDISIRGPFEPLAPSPPACDDERFTPEIGECRGVSPGAILVGLVGLVLLVFFLLGFLG